MVFTCKMSELLELIVNNIESECEQLILIIIIVAEHSGCTNVMAGRFIVLIWVRYRAFVACYKTTLRIVRIVFVGLSKLIDTLDNCKFSSQNTFKH